MTTISNRWFMMVVKTSGWNRRRRVPTGTWFRYKWQCPSADHPFIYDNHRRRPLRHQHQHHQQQATRAQRWRPSRKGRPPPSLPPPPPLKGRPSSTIILYYNNYLRIRYINIVIMIIYIILYSRETVRKSTKNHSEIIKTRLTDNL